MFDATGLVSISLGSVVLDRPDQTGRFIAKDLVGGWAYLVGDADGDSRCRGQGVCEGGLDMTLRCAFLSAAGRVPDCRLIRIFVDTRQAHQTMVRLAVNDSQIVAAIAGRPVSVLTRPDARSLFRVRTAAEQAALAVLREREHTEREAFFAESMVPTAHDAGVVAAARKVEAGPASICEPASIADWRSRLHIHAGPSAAPGAGGAPAGKVLPVTAPPARLRQLVTPILSGGRNALPVAPTPRTQAIKAWLQDFENQVATISGDLQDAGA